MSIEPSDLSTWLRVAALVAAAGLLLQAHRRREDKLLSDKLVVLAIMAIFAGQSARYLIKAVDKADRAQRSVLEGSDAAAVADLIVDLPIETCLTWFAGLVVGGCLGRLIELKRSSSARSQALDARP